METSNLSKGRFPVKLGTITQTDHWKLEGEVKAYEPYVREMRVWAELFESVEIFTPLVSFRTGASISSYQKTNINFKFVNYDSRIFRFAPLIRLIQFPVVFIQMFFFIARHDVLLIRSPGHFSLMAHVLVFLLRKKSITKFAGHFGYFKGERLPSIVERFFIRNFLRSPHYVLVYGRSNRQHLISFFPLVLSRSEIDELRALPVLQEKRDASVFYFYTLGRLTAVKGFDLAIQGLGELFRICPEWKWECHLIGDGPELDRLRKMAIDLAIGDRVIFEGKQNYLNAMKMLRLADVVIMPGVMEGWPKVVAEAWVAGSIPLCANAGLLPEIIIDSENGFLFSPDIESFAKKCLDIKNQQARFSQIVLAGKRESDKLTADHFKENIRGICVHRLKLKQL